ncbi:MAG TPA: STAS domain-containing protein [Pyrinomonadaceae bacterium]|nr:STAS domain-containing protein [Pyrinomonadaceae bacterium]
MAVLRITTHENSNATCFVVEGKLAGPCVVELEKCWERVTAAGEILVELSSVSFVDATGRQLLKRMHEKGTRLIGAGLLIVSIIEEIQTGQTENNLSAAPSK